MNTVSTLSGLAALCVVGSSSAAIITFTQQNVWQNYSALQGAGVYTETFSGIADGFYNSYSGSTGVANWSAAANGGLYVQGGLFSTNNPTALNFDLGSGVNGLAGSFFATDINFNVVASIVTLTLSDGSGFIGYIDSANAYTGFYSTGALITSIRIEAASVSAGNVYPTADTMQFAVVPAPGALVLAGVAAAVGGLRRRR